MLTAVIAWVVFKENADRRIVLGMVLIVGGGVVLAWPDDGAARDWLGPASVAAACLCWAIDTNLTRRISGSDALFIAGIKGLIAGPVNGGLALLLGGTVPAWASVGVAMVVGLLGYGASLVLFVLALRELGAARTGAYFSTAPFLGAAITVVFLGESTTGGFWLAAGLLGLGVWLHLTEHHEHEHVHEPQEHTHRHVHHDHHQHVHDVEWAGDAPHTQLHRHARLVHKHPHFPDLHHRHGH